MLDRFESLSACSHHEDLCAAFIVAFAPLCVWLLVGRKSRLAEVSYHYEVAFTRLIQRLAFQSLPSCVLSHSICGSVDAEGYYLHGLHVVNVRLHLLVLSDATVRRFIVQGCIFLNFCFCYHRHSDVVPQQRFDWGHLDGCLARGADAQQG